MQEDKIKILIANKIKKLRENANLSQEQLGTLISMEQPNISNIETAKNLPSILTVIALIKVFKVSPNSFLDFLDDYDEINVNDKTDIDILEYILKLPAKTKAVIAELIKQA